MRERGRDWEGVVQRPGGSEDERKRERDIGIKH